MLKYDAKKRKKVRHKISTLTWKSVGKMIDDIISSKFDKLLR